jgi:tetratricopeptide (TPR) repeat protein
MSEFLPGDFSQMLSLGIAATDRGEYAAALQLLQTVYTRVTPESAPQGLSSYGLCLARVEGRRKLGAELCQRATQLEFYEGKHWANLVRVYITAKNRRKAVETLDDSLRRLRNDPALLRVRKEIGYRQAPTLQFLPRTHFLNKVYGRMAVRFRRVAKQWKVLAIIAGSLLYVAALLELFRWITT